MSSFIISLPFTIFLICHIKLYENLAKKGQHLLHNHCNLLFRSGRFLRHKSIFYVGRLPGLPDDLRIMCRNKIKSSITAVQQHSEGVSAAPAMWQGGSMLDKRREGLALTKVCCGDDTRAICRENLSLQQVGLPSHLLPQALRYWLGSSQQQLASSRTMWCPFNPIPHPHCWL